MPRRRGNTNMTIRGKPPTGLPQHKRFIRRRSIMFLPTPFMTLAGCNLQQLRRRLPPHSTQAVSLRRRQRVVPQLSRALFLTALLLQANKQKDRRANYWLLRLRRIRLLRRKPQAREQLNNLPFLRQASLLGRQRALNQWKRLLQFRHRDPA